MGEVICVALDGVDGDGEGVMCERGDKGNVDGEDEGEDTDEVEGILRRGEGKKDRICREEDTVNDEERNAEGQF